MRIKSLLIFRRRNGSRIMTSSMKQQLNNHHTSHARDQPGYKTLTEIPKTNVFTSKLPPDPAFPTPASSHEAERAKLGPRLVKGALFTYVRPIVPEEPELLAVSDAALRDIGLRPDVVDTQLFRDAVSGSRIITWSKDDDVVDSNNSSNNNSDNTNKIYPWAQCYGGYQFGQWAGQLGDGRAISLFETVNPSTRVRYELQLKGAGRTPYSRFADGRAVLRSSIREFIVSEALNALGIPSTRALAITLTPRAEVRRERIEPGAIVARFAQSWLRIGTFDLLRARGDRKLLRQLATYVAEDVLGGWETLPGKRMGGDHSVQQAVKSEEVQGSGKQAENRFARLYRDIARRNAATVAAWQAYGFMNGVLNTDNTSIMGLSMDFGPFAFMDDFDPSYTPNHDDFMLRYNYRNQPTIIWWNLVRLGEALGELIGAGPDVDNDSFISTGPSDGMREELVERAEHIISSIGEEYKAVFTAEYKRLMTARLGLKGQRDADIGSLLSEWLDILKMYELDFNHSFRRLSNIRLVDIGTEEARLSTAGRFFHREGIAGNASGKEEKEQAARKLIASWLEVWRTRIIEDWGGEGQESKNEKEEAGAPHNDDNNNNNNNNDKKRVEAMKRVNPKFIPRSWILDEVIQRVEKKREREILKRVLDMSLRPFEERWGWNEEEEERFCGDVPRFSRAMQCSCSS